MRGVRNIVSTLVAVVAMLMASAWSSTASACLFESTGNDANVVAGGPATLSPSKTAHHQLHQQHRHTIALRQKMPSSPGGPPAPRLDCAACMAVLPNFPSMGPPELMPFMPNAEAFEPLSGIDPALDPPPPRRARP